MDIKPVGWKPDGTHINVLGIIIVLATLIFTFDPYDWFTYDNPEKPTKVEKVVKEK